MLDRFEQLWNTLLPSFSSPSGSLIDVSPVHPAKALSPIVFKALGKHIFLMFTMSLKVSFPISLILYLSTLDGIYIFVSEPLYFIILASRPLILSHSKSSIGLSNGLNTNPCASHHSCA